MNLVDRLLVDCQRSAAVFLAALCAWACGVGSRGRSCRSRSSVGTRSILTSGVTIYNDRYESLPTDSLRVEEMKRDEVLFYREGLTTTVSVHKHSRQRLCLLQIQRQDRRLLRRRAEPIDDQLYRHDAASESRDRADHRPGQRHVGQGAGDFSSLSKTSKSSRSSRR